MAAVEPRPAGVPDATGRRIEHLPAAIVGNGSLLATLSGRGELERLFWPNVDWGQHLGELRIGVAVDGTTHWLDEAPFEHEQNYFEDASVLRTVARGGSLELEITDLVLPDEPVLVRRVRAEGASLRLVAYCRPELDEKARGVGAYVVAERGAVVFYRRDRALALAMSPAGEATCGRSRRGETYSVLEDAADAELEGEAVAHRSVEGAVACELAGEASLVCAFGSSPEEALARLDAPLRAGFEELLARRTGHDAERLAGAPEPQAGPDGLEPLYRRSLLVFDLLADRETGGVIAAPELDPDFVNCGGYGFVWGRDLAFIVLAFLAGGREDLARRALRWLVRTQAPEGLWLQRHWTDGSLAPCWSPHQIDETGAVLFAFEAACRELADPELERELWPPARRAADFLCAFLDPDTGLPRASTDLWEEGEGQHAFSAAAVCGGLRAAAALAARLEPARAERYAAAARRVSTGIETHLWSESDGHYLRSRWRGRSDRLGEPVPPAFDSGLPYPNRTVRSVDPVDARVDVSLLGLAWPFGAVDPSSARMRATVEAIERALQLADGGVMRFEGDTYAGGNPWILATLWLGLWHRLVGDDAGHRRALEYAVRRQTSVGLLPEQATRDGRPAWVVPLTWSHAMLVLAARPELAPAARAT